MAESRKLKKVYPYNAALALAYTTIDKGELYESFVAIL